MNMATVLKDYALPIILMAMISCVMVGIAKSFIKPKKTSPWLSRLYIVFALVAAFLCVMVYYLWIIEERAFTTWAFWKDIMLVSSCAQVVYQIYEKFGGRTLIKKVITAFKGRSRDLDKIIDSILEIIGDAEGVPPVAKDQIKTEITSEKVRAKLDKPAEPQTPIAEK